MHFHIHNLSSAENLPLIASCKSQGAIITTETCPHYLSLAAEDIQDCRTEFKTHPPIREGGNRLNLWNALSSRNLDLIASNHTAASPGAKLLIYGKSRGNFLNAFPGISSLQLGRFSHNITNL